MQTGGIQCILGCQSLGLLLKRKLEFGLFFVRQEGFIFRRILTT